MDHSLQVAYKQFWARYFYKAGKVEHEEERKKKVPSNLTQCIDQMGFLKSTPLKPVSSIL